MVSTTMIVFFLIRLLVRFVAAQSLPQPSDSPACKVSPDLSSCRGYLEGSASKPPPLCCDRLARAVQSSYPRCLCRTLRGGASIAVNKDQALCLADVCKLQPHALGRCYDGSGMTDSPAESPNEMSASFIHSHRTNGLCPDCRDGSIDPASLIPTPPS